jgi:hypothetical protein
MADVSPLAGLLDRAGNVFFLALQLGRTFHEERQIQGGVGRIDPTGWDRHQPAFNEFCAAVLDLRDAMQNPPDGFAPVAQALMKAAGVAKEIRDTMQKADGRTWAAYLDFFPELNTVAAAGREAIRDVTEARRPDDPFAFVDQLGSTATPPPQPVTVDPTSNPGAEREIDVPLADATIAEAREKHAWLQKLSAVNTTIRSFATPPAIPPTETSAPDSKTKRGTERGEGRTKLIAALTKHHQYAESSCLNPEPIGNNDLAKAAGVSPSTASAFFNDQFEGHAKYKALCRDSGELLAALKLLNNEFAPRHLYGRRPAGEDNRDDEGNG